MLGDWPLRGSPQLIINRRQVYVWAQMKIIGLQNEIVIRALEDTGQQVCHG
jgi:hypothetical protein